MKSYYLFLLFLGFSTAGYMSCTSKNQKDISKINHEILIKKGNEITAQLAATLMARLTEQIEKNGVTGAIRYCSLHALAITDSLSKQHQVQISRVSHRYRNPQNAARHRELHIIDQYLQLLAEGASVQPQIIADTMGHVYYAPIFISMPTCLKCHGHPEKDITMETLDVLRQLYPDDRATGFSLGDLRGLFKVTFDVSK